MKIKFIDYELTNAQDSSFIFEVYASTRSDEINKWGWEPLQQQAFLRMQFEAQRRSYVLQYPNLQTKIILFAGIQVGRLLTAMSEEAVTVVDITILPEYQNQGIGKTILEEIIRDAAQINLPVRLTVRKDNHAKFLYSRLGFDEKEEDELHLFMEKSH